jgi:hypothetical protein
MSHDIAVSPAGIPAISSTSNKPLYLVTVEDSTGKTKVIKRFITLDRPEQGNGFISAKGFFCEASEDEIITSFSTMLTTIKKESIIDVMIPWHKICYVRSLVFKAK